MMSTLFHLTIVFGIASVVALIVLRFSGSRRPWVHQIVWGGVLLLGLLGMRIPCVVPVEIETQAEPVKLESTIIVSDPVLPIIVAQQPVESAPVVKSVSVETTLPKVEPIVQPTSVETKPAKPISLAATLFTVWFVGLAGFLLWHFVHYFRLLRLLAKAESPDADTQILWSEICTRHHVSEHRRPKIKMISEGGPAMIRMFFGYTLLLSKSHWDELDDELRRGVMRHELAHFLYGDVWKIFCARFIVLVHWFNPLAHLASRRFEESIEWSADSFSYGAEENGLKQFAAAMIALHETTPQNYRYRVAFGSKDLLRRLEFLKQTKNGSKESSLKTGFVLGLSLVLFVLGTVNIKIVAQEKKPTVMQRATPTTAAERIPVEPPLRFPGSIYDNSPHADKLNDYQVQYVIWDETTFKRYYSTEFCRSDKTDDEMESEWISVLKEREPFHRSGFTLFYRAINGLAMLKSKKGIPDLLRIATERIHKDNSYRHNSVKALGWIGDPKVVPDLIPMLYFLNMNCRLEAQISLVRLTGQNFGYDWKAWGTWWNEHRNEFGDNMPAFDMKFVDWVNVGPIWYLTDDLKKYFDVKTNPELLAFADPEVQKIQDRIFLLERVAAKQLEEKKKILNDELTEAAKKSLKGKVRQIEEVDEADFPKVVATNPPNGAKDVDPSLTELRVTFDRPMGTGVAWYTLDGGETFPKTTLDIKESSKWSEDRKTNTVTGLVLEPGKTYNVWFNTEEELQSLVPFDGFRSEKNVPLKPIHYQFTTRPKAVAE